jgi:hypothetical protein
MCACKQIARPGRMGQEPDNSVSRYYIVKFFYYYYLWNTEIGTHNSVLGIFRDTSFAQSKKKSPGRGRLGGLP